MADLDSELRGLLVEADSILSLILHRRRSAVAELDSGGVLMDIERLVPRLRKAYEISRSRERCQCGCNYPDHWQHPSSTEEVKVMELERKQTLLEITDAIVRAVEEYDAAEGDAKLTAMDAVERIISQDLARKVDGIAWFDKRCKSEIDGLKQLKDEIDSRINAIKRRQEWVRAIARSSMQRLGVTKLKGDVRSIILIPGRTSLDITDPSAIPVQYLTIPPVQPIPMKDEIRKALEAGEDVPGAQLVTGDEILQVR